MVTLAEHKKTLLIKRASGESFSLELPPIDAREIGCRVFFDLENRNVAVSLDRLRSEADSLHIVVGEVSTGKWISNFVVRTDGIVGRPLTLLGFLRNSLSLVILGDNTRRRAKGFATMLLDIRGNPKAPSASRDVPDNTSQVGSPSYADVGNNRLWFQSSPEYCPLRSVPLVGDGPEGPTVDKSTCRGACDLLFSRAYPNADTLMLAASREPRDLLWRIDLKEHSAEELELPSIGGYGTYTSVERGFASPDGRVFAVARNLLSNSLLGDAHSRGTEVDVVQVSPLRVIGKVRLNSGPDPASLSIDYRNGTVTILSFENGKWHSEYLKTE
jgi:hypothetical protein